MNNNGQNDYLPTIKVELAQIVAELDILLGRRAIFQQHITALGADGCVHGNIVAEYRGGNGPYYRLTFYTDPATSIKPKPVYIGSDEERRARVQQQIANHQERMNLQHTVAKIDTALGYARQRVDELRRYLVNQNRPELQQLVIPVEVAGAGGVTKGASNEQKT